MQLLVVVALWLASSAAPSQTCVDATPLQTRDVALPTRFVGRVITPNGVPARGATVTSSAGGEAIAGADGSFELVADVPLDARSVEVTAALQDAKHGSLTASARVLPATLAPLTSVGTLVVASGTGARARWRPAFGALPGVSGSVDALAVFDDGDGPALYVGGDFSAAGGLEARSIARWDGRRWSVLGDGLGGGGFDPVQALVVFDDGTGPALYAGGTFVGSGATLASRVARWDGASWSPLGSGTNGTVRDLAVFDDGSGPALYATGEFTSAGGVPAQSIARWDGTSWSALGSGISGGAGRALAVFDDDLYVAGGFTTAGGAPASRIARWDGATWQTLGSGTSDVVYALSVFDSGSGAALYAGGRFTVAGGASALRVARWNGASWSGVAGGTNRPVLSLATLDLGGGPALYAGGEFTTAGGVTARGVARWNGTSWVGVGNGALDAFDVSAFTTFDRGDGPELHCGGSFSLAGTVEPRSVARLDGTQWAELNHGPGGIVSAILPVDLGGTQQLYVGGLFTSIDGVPAKRIAHWNGSTWSALGSGLTAAPGVTVWCRALALYDDGAGEDLYATGSFTGAGGMPALAIARWDGSTWSAVGSGSHGGNALIVFDDGSGPALYAGGAGLEVSRWNGVSWADLSHGLNDEVNAFTVFDDGTGPALYAGGAFTSSSAGPMSHVARWTGSGWAAVGSGTTTTVNTFAVFDDGSGPALYAAGDAEISGSVSHITRWDGTSWSVVGSSTGFGAGGLSFHALAAIDDGSGPALFAAGSFSTIDGVAARYVAKWDGASWSPLGAGLGRSSVLDGMGLALAQLHDDGGPALLVGGNFTVSPARDSYLAKWSVGRKILGTH